MGAAATRQLLLRVPVAPASWEMFSSAVRYPFCASFLFQPLITLSSQRRVQRAAEVEAIKAMAHDPVHEDELMTEDGALSDEPESEEGVDSNDDAATAGAAVVVYRERGQEPRSIKVENRHPDAMVTERHNGHAWVLSQSWHDDDDDGDLDGDVPLPVTKHAYGTTRRTRPVGLADLDSQSGR